VSYVIGADGGNSKTDLVLADDQGTVLAHVRGSGTRPYTDGLSVTMKALAELAGLAIERADLPPGTAVASAALYLANVDLPEDEDDAQRRLTRLGLADHVLVRNDTFAVLRAGTARDWGVAVVVGAGINAAGIGPDGREERFLALGAMSGDWGGGEGLAIAGLGAAVRAADGRGPATILRELVLATFGLDAEAVAVGVDRGTIPYDRLHELSPIVFRAADDGDPVSIALVARLADEVVSMAAALLRRLELVETDADIVLGGSVLQAGHADLIAQIEAGLQACARDVTVRVLNVPPVAGALVDALTRAGASADAIARVRAGAASLS
jgi:N-acetylglucosamine kinase-like BadF-type ATPase